MPVSACAAVGSCSFAAFVLRRSLENACFSSLDTSFILHAHSSRASFRAAPVASARYQVSSAVLRCVLCNASERRSYTRATKCRCQHAQWADRALFRRFTISTIMGPLCRQGSLVSNERSLHAGEAACVSTRAGRRGALSSASDGHMVETATQDDLSGHAGTPLDRGRRHGFGLSKQVLLHRFGGAGEAADCLSTATHRHRGLRTLRFEAFHRCGARRRNRSISRAHLQSSEALLPR